MDIKRKQTVLPSAPRPESTDLPQFFEQDFRVRPEGPYHLGEEQLWFRPEPETGREEEILPVSEPRESRLNPKEFFSRPKRRNFSLPFRFRLRPLLYSLGVLLLALFSYGFLVQGTLEKNIETGILYTERGVDELGKKNFPEARKSFLLAKKHFQSARQKTLYFPAWAAKPVALFPGTAKAGSGILALDASTHLAEAALHTTTLLETVARSRQSIEQGGTVSYLDTLASLEVPLLEMSSELKRANSSLQAIRLQSIPEERRLTFELLQKGVPGLAVGIDSLLANTPLIEELLGKNGPRIYLFLFQNNQELRPTGGFIGTYGILEFKDGHARRFFIDGIFNPDGQLKENIVPPKPIQKMSAGWSLHDSNWFPDFPTSAEKAIYFYEKTGGPTVDGVFTLTPTVMERLFAVTGPIELPEYEMVVDSKNFIPTIQEQVEIKYDKVENKPKKVLADLASLLLERVFSTTDPSALYQVADILVTGMNEKHILLYTRNPKTQRLIEQSGWSGKVEPNTHDYLSVINTNINGFKTDGVIKDTVEHDVTVEEDGALLATVRVTRKHTGGNTPYEWWNRVNSNYMRVYVPQGSELIRASGHTREFPPAPLDYDLLGFQRDETVQNEENRITLHEASGTRVGEEFGKTVFGNWVYVSPGEEVVVEYTYLLPFRLNPEEKGRGSYSLLFQKQPGTQTVDFRSRLEYPKDWKLYWQSENELLRTGESGIQLERTLRNDAFWGVVFRK